MEQRKSLRPWAVLVGCCLLCAAAFALPLLCFGVFVSPMTAYFGGSVTEVNLYFTFMTAAAVVSSVFGARILNHSLRGTVVVCSFMMGAAYVALALFPSVPLVWAVGVVEGLLYPLCSSILVPIIINRWFAKQQATFVGVSFAVVGATGVALGPVLTALIAALGWQMALTVTGVAMFVVCALVAILLLRTSPQAEGVLPYGAKSCATEDDSDATVVTRTQLSGPPYRAVFGTSAFFLIAAAAILSGFLGVFNTQANAVAQQSGFSAVVAGIAFSCVSGGLFVGKILLGWVKDKCGTVLAVGLGCGVGIAAFACMIVAVETANVWLLYASCAFGGLCTCLGTIGPALLASEAFGSRAYDHAVSHATAFCNLGMAVGAPLYSLSFDVLGSYVPVLIACAAAPLLTLAVTWFGIRKGKELQQGQWE